MSHRTPVELSPRAAAWLQMQTSVAASRAAQVVQGDLEDLEGFVNGMLVTMAQLVPLLLEAVPEVAQQLAPHWREAAERYDALIAPAAAGRDDDAVRLLEARKLLYRCCERLGVWSAATRSRRGQRLQCRVRTNTGRTR